MCVGGGKGVCVCGCGWGWDGKTCVCDVMGDVEDWEFGVVMRGRGS